MRFLVTGVTGQVGSALKDTLAKAGTVYATDRSEFDLSRPGDMAASLDRINPSLIVNAAAYTAVDRAEDEKELAYRVDAEAPGVMAHWAASRGIPLSTSRRTMCSTAPATNRGEKTTDRIRYRFTARVSLPARTPCVQPAAGI